MTASARGTVRVELQELAIITLDQLLADLGQTTPAGITLAPASAPRTALSLQPLSVSLPAVLSPSLVSTIANSTTPIQRTLATGVTAFSFNAGPGPGVSLPLSVTLALQRSTANSTQTYQVTRQVLLRNTH